MNSKGEEHSKVLVVEASTLLRRSHEHLLSTQGFDVQMVATIEEAKGALADEPFDLVITDLLLEPLSSHQGLTGIEVIQQLKQVDSRVPIVALTSLSLLDLHHLGELSALGITLVRKDDPLHFVQAVRDALSRPDRPPSTSKSPHDPEREALLLEGVRQAVSEELANLFTLTVPGEGTYSLPKALQGFKKDIERQIVKFPFEQNVFLMMKYRSTNQDVGDYIIELLQQRGFRAVRADDREWNITRNVYNPIAVLYCCKYGIALFDEPEDHQAYSPNVAYELGIMHQQNKECLILRHSTLPQVPFDLIKDLYVSYDRDLHLRRIIERWVEEIAARRE
jgi:CheY-like chemotaxis protein